MISRRGQRTKKHLSKLMFPVNQTLQLIAHDDEIGRGSEPTASSLSTFIFITSSQCLGKHLLGKPVRALTDFQYIMVLYITGRELTDEESAISISNRHQPQ